MFVMYAILLAAATHNTARFIFGRERPKNFHINYFYILVYSVIFLRIVWLSLIIVYVNNWTPNDNLFTLGKVLF